EFFYEGIIQNEGFIHALQKAKENLLFVPIPLYKKRQKTRGYNQAEILAHFLSRKLDVAVVSCIERVKETVFQNKLDAKQRKENVQGAFRVIPQVQQSVRNASVFLVD